MSTKRPADALAAWRSFLRMREAFEARTAPRLEALAREVEARLHALEEGERACVEAQAAELARVRSALARDARFVLRTPAFRAWAAGVLAAPRPADGPLELGEGPEGAGDEGGHLPLDPDPSLWSIAHGRGALALRGARAHEADDYDDERDFVAERVTVAASLGLARGDVSFSACRRYGPHERELCGPGEVLVEAAEAAGAWLRPAPGPGGEGVAYEVAALAIFCAPMLLAEPARVRPAEALARRFAAAPGDGEEGDGEEGEGENPYEVSVVRRAAQGGGR